MDLLPPPDLAAKPRSPPSPVLDPLHQHASLWGTAVVHQPPSPSGTRWLYRTLPPWSRHRDRGCQGALPRDARLRLPRVAIVFLPSKARSNLPRPSGDHRHGSHRPFGGEVRLSFPTHQREVADLKQLLRQLAGSRALDADAQHCDVFKG
uniref:Uncharacterized protein n=1 Tax=Zea mays TaxID=4577 RepID=A0A804MFW9_MAIZE